MYKTIFEINKMDCPSEENLIRMKLDGISSIANLAFDIPNRKLTVFHNGEIDQIEKSVFELNLGGKKISTEQTDKTEFSENSNQKTPAPSSPVEMKLRHCGCYKAIAGLAPFRLLALPLSPEHRQ